MIKIPERSGMFSCHIWQLPASLKDTIAGKFWNDVQIWTFSLAMFKLQFRQFWICQIWQQTSVLATDDACQFWQLTIFANFANWRYLWTCKIVCRHVCYSCPLMCCKPSLACSFTSEFIVLSLMSSLYGCASGSDLQQIVCGRRKLHGSLSKQYWCSLQALS